MISHHKGKKRFGLANMLFVVVVLLVIIRYSWARSYYVCNLTGRKKIVDRVFCVPVQTTRLDTDTSRWLDERLGPTQYRMWHRGSLQTMIGPSCCACKSIPYFLYQWHQRKPDSGDTEMHEWLETLRKDRQTIKQNTDDAEFEVED